MNKNMNWDWIKYELSHIGSHCAHVTLCIAHHVIEVLSSPVSEDVAIWLFWGAFVAPLPLTMESRALYVTWILSTPIRDSLHLRLPPIWPWTDCSARSPLKTFAHMEKWIWEHLEINPVLLVFTPALTRIWSTELEFRVASDTPFL